MIGNIVKKYMMSRILENVPIFELRKAVEKNNPVYEKANTRKNSDLSQSFFLSSRPRIPIPFIRF